MQRTKAPDAEHALCGVPLAGGSDRERGGEGGGAGGGEEDDGCAGALGPFWKHRGARGRGCAAAAAGTSADCVDYKFVDNVTGIRAVSRVDFETASFFSRYHDELAARHRVADSALEGVSAASSRLLRLRGRKPQPPVPLCHLPGPPAVSLRKAKACRTRRPAHRKCPQCPPNPAHSPAAMARQQLLRQSLALPTQQLGLFLRWRLPPSRTSQPPRQPRRRGHPHRHRHQKHPIQRQT